MSLCKGESFRLVDVVSEGHNPYAKKVQFTNYTLRYNRMKWVSAWPTHWKEVESMSTWESQFRVKTQNVTKLMLGKLEESDQGTTKYDHHRQLKTRNKMGSS